MSEQNSDQGPHDGASHHQQDNFSARDRLKGYIVDFAELFGIPAGALYFVWQNRTDTFTIVVTGIAVVGFVHGLSRVFNFKRRKPAVGITFALSVVGCVSWYFAVKPSESGPQLQLVLHSPRFPTIDLFLTNKELFQETRTNVVKAVWMLVIPVRSKDEFAPLRLSVWNDSTNKSAAGFEVVVQFSDDIEVASGTIGEWSLNEFPGARSLSHRENAPLYPLKMRGLRDIGLKLKGGWPNPPEIRPLFMEVSSSDTVPMKIAVKLICPIVEIPEEPYLLPPGGQYRYLRQ